MLIFTTQLYIGTTWAGTAQYGQPCTTQSDCENGLWCRPVPDGEPGHGGKTCQLCTNGPKDQNDVPCHTSGSFCQYTGTSINGQGNDCPWKMDCYYPAQPDNDTKTCKEITCPNHKHADPVLDDNPKNGSISFSPNTSNPNQSYVSESPSYNLTCVGNVYSVNVHQNYDIDGFDYNGTDYTIHVRYDDKWYSEITPEYEPINRLEVPLYPTRNGSKPVNDLKKFNGYWLKPVSEEEGTMVFDANGIPTDGSTTLITSDNTTIYAHWKPIDKYRLKIRIGDSSSRLFIVDCTSRLCEFDPKTACTTTAEDGKYVKEIVLDTPTFCNNCSFGKFGDDSYGNFTLSDQSVENIYKQTDAIPSLTIGKMTFQPCLDGFYCNHNCTGEGCTPACKSTKCPYGATSEPGAKKESDCFWNASTVFKDNTGSFKLPLPENGKIYLNSN